MKYLILTLIIFEFCGACSENNSQIPINSPSNSFDSILAKKYGADEYGMKQYVMAFLKAGPNRDQDSLTIVKIQRAHLDNISKMQKEGKLILAGPFMDETEIKGIYIFNVRSLDEAKAITSSDPAIKAGRLIMELHPWYGPASLIGLDSLQNKLSKKSI